MLPGSNPEVLVSRRADLVCAGNEERLTGKHETCDMNTFRYGVADRGSSIRIPLPVQASSPALPLVRTVFATGACSALHCISTVSILSTVPTVDRVLLESGKSNKG